MTTTDTERARGTKESGCGRGLDRLQCIHTPPNDMGTGGTSAILGLRSNNGTGSCLREGRAQKGEHEWTRQHATSFVPGNGAQTRRT